MELILSSVSFLTAFALVLIAVPPIIRVANAKELFDFIDERKIHTTKVPPLGGVAIFIGFTLSSIVSTDGLSFDSLKYIIAAVIMMFFIGLKDDLLVIAPLKKFIVQFFAAVLLVTLGEVRFTNLHGIFGIYEIDFIPGLGLTIFTILAIINAYNLIDGIDGLAAGLTILAASVFGVWFYLAGETQFAILSFALVGSVAGFFLFNVFGKKNKLFMGDTGSLMIGIVVSTLAIKFNEFNVARSVPFAIDAAPAVSFAIVIIPLIDMMRVMFIRIIRGKSPFFADKNHLHHRLLKLMENHLKVSLTIVLFNMLIIGLAFYLNSMALNVNIQFILVFFAGLLLTTAPALMLKIRASKLIPGTGLVNQSGFERKSL